MASPNLTTTERLALRELIEAVAWILYLEHVEYDDMTPDMQSLHDSLQDVRLTFDMPERVEP